MIVELPVVANDDVYAEGRPGVVCDQKKVERTMLVNLDCIQSIMRMQDDKVCLMSFINRDKCIVAMPYAEMKGLWFRFNLMREQCDFVTYDKASISESNNPAFKFIDEDMICAGCSGINLGVVPDGNAAVCRDCGVVKPINDKV